MRCCSIDVGAARPCARRVRCSRCLAARQAAVNQGRRAFVAWFGLRGLPAGATVTLNSGSPKTVCRRLCTAYSNYTYNYSTLTVPYSAPPLRYRSSTHAVSRNYYRASYPSEIETGRSRRQGGGTVDPLPPNRLVSIVITAWQEGRGRSSQWAVCA